MKKSISKTDKKKKKELAEQTEKMEQDLQKRHAEELNELTAQLQKGKVGEHCNALGAHVQATGTDLEIPGLVSHLTFSCSIIYGLRKCRHSETMPLTRTPFVSASAEFYLRYDFRELPRFLYLLMYPVSSQYRASVLTPQCITITMCLIV